MDTYKKLSDYDSKQSLSSSDQFPVISDNGDGTYSNYRASLQYISSFINTSNHDNMVTTIDGEIQSKTQDIVNGIIDQKIVDAKNAMFPVGSIYINATNGQNPATLLGIGTWSKFASGRVLVGDGTSDQSFIAGSTGGESKHQLTVAELASHTHNQYTYSTKNGASGGGNFYQDSGTQGSYVGTWTNTIANTGGDTPHNNLQPYVVVYMWIRTA